MKYLYLSIILISCHSNKNYSYKNHQRDSSTIVDTLKGKGNGIGKVENKKDSFNDVRDGGVVIKGVFYDMDQFPKRSNSIKKTLHHFKTYKTAPLTFTGHWTAKWMPFNHLYSDSDFSGTAIIRNNSGQPFFAVVDSSFHTVAYIDTCTHKLVMLDTAKTINSLMRVLLRYIQKDMKKEIIYIK